MGGGLGSPVRSPTGSSSSALAEGFALTKIERRYGRHRAFGVEHLALGDRGLTAIVGPNGAGKSTLLGLLSRAIRPSSGAVHLDGCPAAAFGTAAFARHVAHLAQLMPPAPGLSVRELVALGRYPWRGAFARLGERDWRIVDQSIVEVGLATSEARLVDTLSGGERQRAWIAMALAQDARILLVDEPTAVLDIGQQVSTLSLLRARAEGARAVIAVLHDINLAARFADRVIAVAQGRIAFDGRPEHFMQPEVLGRIFDVELCLATHPRAGTPVALVA